MWSLKMLMILFSCLWLCKNGRRDAQLLPETPLPLHDGPGNSINP